MAFLEDLSDYAYAGLEFARPGTKAVGWLAVGHAFPTMAPEDEVLDLLWQYSSVSIARMRGGHECEFCDSRGPHFAERYGEERLLGVAEIRVFGAGELVYAAPTLIYHYVAVHHYRPPDEFLRALREGPKPPSRQYFDALTRLKLQWSDTPGKRVGS